MKKLIVIFTICLFFVALPSQPATPKSSNTKPYIRGRSGAVEVLYFHGKRRCATCLAIENQTGNVVKTVFAKATTANLITYKVIDISLKENAPIAEKYQVN